ncbi:transferase [Xylariales sp. PMI_506]|nr:transferase [Xylariales sp. PMI_506]
MADLKKAHFVSTALGDTSRFIVEGMEYGEKPETLANANPVIAAFQANFIPGGLIFVINQHHYANDAMGWASFIHQFAENCAAEVNKTTPPVWDPANLDGTRFTATDFPSDKKVDGPTSPNRHPGLKEHAALLFHLPLSKAAKLKELASTQDGSWVSTYDAFIAYLWRVVTRRRAELYGASPSDAPLFIEGVNMRKRVDPPLAPRFQRNLFWGAVSAQHPSPLTVEEISSSLPLSTLASKIRSMTDATNNAALEAALAMLAPIRDKTSLFTRVNAMPPLTLASTDWRDADVCTADFGFARPIAYRHLFNSVTEGLVLIYPRRPAAGADAGCEFVITVEKEIVQGVQDDLAEYFEFRGYEV